MKRIVIAAGLALVVLLGGWYEGLYRQESAHLSSLNAKQAAAVNTVVGFQMKYIALVRSKRQLPAEQATLARLRRAVPDGPELDKLVTALFSACNEAHVQLETISSPEPSGFGPGAVSTATGTSGPAQLSVSLTVAGSAAEVADLYRILDTEPRLFVIDNFGLTYTTAPSPAAGGAAKASQNDVVLQLRAFYAVATSSTPGS